MAIYEIGGNQIPVQASEGLAEIPPNRTLLVQQLTDQLPVVPETVYGLETVHHVFDYFKPGCEVELENEDGAEIKEMLHFKSLADFKPDMLIMQSELMREMAMKREIFGRISKQLHKNRALRKLLESPESITMLLNVFSNLDKELSDQ